jgi:hypothetical protein
MSMQQEGPPLQSLIRRIAETPAEFLASVRVGESGDVHVPAVVNDLFRMRGVEVPVQALAPFAGRNAKTDRNPLSITLLMCWLLADDSLRALKLDTDALLALLRDAAKELAVYGSAAKFVQDADRREELARLSLSRLGMRPAGETVAQAEDRLISLSSAEHARVLRASRDAEKRAQEIRAALARKAAEESADKYTRE